MPKVPKTVTIDKELLDWLEEMVNCREFGSVSHGIEKALYKLKKEYDQK